MATIANRFHLPSLMYGITGSCGLFVQGVLFPVVLFLSRNQPPVCSHGDHCKQVSFTFPHVGAFCHPYATPSVLSPGLPTIQFLITYSERKWKGKAWEHSLREWCQFLLRSTEEGRRRLWTSFMQVFFFWIETARESLKIVSLSTPLSSSSVYPGRDWHHSYVQYLKAFSLHFYILWAVKNWMVKTSVRLLYQPPLVVHFTNDQRFMHLHTAFSCITIVPGFIPDFVTSPFLTFVQSGWKTLLTFLILLP